MRSSRAVPALVVGHLYTQLTGRDKPPPHLVFKVGKAFSAYPMVASTEFVVVARRVPFMLDVGGVPIGELGPTSGTVVVIPIGTRSFPFPLLERNSLEKMGRADAPLLIWSHKCHYLSAGRICPLCESRIEVAMVAGGRGWNSLAAIAAGGPPGGRGALRKKRRAPAVAGAQARTGARSTVRRLRGRAGP